MFVFVRIRPGSLTRPSRRTCPSLLWRNTTRTKNTETPRRAEVCVGLNAKGNLSCVEASGGQRCPVSVLSLSCSHEELHQHGLLRQQENPTQAEEVPDPPANPAGRQRQGLHQRCWAGPLASPACGVPLVSPPLLCLRPSDQVFGCSLSDLCHRESATVPAFVKMCIDHVESSCRCW